MTYNQSNPFENWFSTHSSLEQIVYREPANNIRQIETKNGSSRMIEMITFIDGSTLALSAKVPMPPLNDMTPKEVYYIKGDGEHGVRKDDGSSEALDLARQSMAIRLLEKLSQLIDEIPQAEMVACPSCGGDRVCPNCCGEGCDECGGSGFCPDCHGHGQVTYFD